jgi:aryl-alcohol dehydrogenase-like predicted oxidoreductase
MNQEFTHTTFGNTGKTVFRMGLSGTYRPGRPAVYKALDEGVNFFFCFGFDTQILKVLRDVFRNRREDFVVATGPYNLIWGHPNLRRTLEKRLRQLRTDYIDAFLFLGVLKEQQYSENTLEELSRFREEGKVRTFGLSTHDRKLAGKLAADGSVDALMVRYNAAHRGAEQDIFPHLRHHNPGLASYTATRWRYLLRRPGSWPKDQPVPTAGMCYRFVLSNPHVDVCLTAPSNAKQLQENLAAMREGPLSREEMIFMRRFGDAVHDTRKWFM